MTTKIAVVLILAGAVFLAAAQVKEYTDQHAHEIATIIVGFLM